MCNCIKRLQKELTENMKKQFPGWKVLDTVEFQNTNYVFSTDCYVLENPAVGRVYCGKLVRKYKSTILPKYCPFCGEKIEVKR